jgi:hypothetical protein
MTKIPHVNPNLYSVPKIIVLNVTGIGRLEHTLLHRNNCLQLDHTINDDHSDDRPIKNMSTKCGHIKMLRLWSQESLVLGYIFGLGLTYGV